MKTPPNDQRAFFHRKVLGFVGGAIGGFAQGGITGAISGGIRGARGGGRGGQRTAISPADTGPFQTSTSRTSVGPFGWAYNRETTVQRPTQTIGGEVYQTRGVRANVPLLGSGNGQARRRRMNVSNPKALRRSIRRLDGFVKLATRALKGTDYKVTRRGSSRSRSRPPAVIVESGPGSVVAR